MRPEPSRSSLADRLSAIPVSWVRQEGGWSLYSRLVNFVSCAARDAATGDTWLGTHLGIRRVTPDGTLRRIYTGADGLPGHGLRALAVGPDGAWCIVVPDHRRGRFALCRLDRGTDRWDSLREVTPPPTHVSMSHEPHYPDFLSVGPRYLACVFGHVARRENGFAFCVLDRERGTWRDIPWEPERRESHPHTFGFSRDCFPEPRWLHLDDESVFVGTAQGLGRYDLAAGAWDWPLTDAVMGGGADGGTLWLAAWRAGAMQGSFPDLVGLDAATGRIARRFLSPLAETAPFPRHARVAVIPEQGSLWLVEQKVASHREPEPSAPLLVRFEAATESWHLGTGSAGDLPPSVRLAAALAWPGPPPEELREYLPGFFSPAADLPVVPEDVRRPPPPEQLRDEAEAAVWAVADRTVLVRRPEDGGMEQRHPLPDMVLPITPPVSSVAILNDMLYASTTDGLWRRGLPDGDWTLIPLPETTPGRRAIAGRLLAVAGHLWVEASDSLWHYDPASSAFRQVTPAPGLARPRLLSADRNRLWLADGSPGWNLFHLDVQSLQPSLVPVRTEIPGLPAPPGFRYPANLAAVCGGIAWYRQTFDVVQSGHTKVIGYDLSAGVWTQPLTVTGHVPIVSLRVGPNGVFAAFGPRTGGILHGQAGDIHRYDPQTDQWEEAAPPPPRSASAKAYSDVPPLRLASVDDESFWLVNPDTAGLWRWDRGRRTWAEHTTGGPLRMSERQAEGTVARHAAHFFVSSDRGLWQFDVEGETWTRLPFPASAADRLEVAPCFVNERSVWALCHDIETRQTFAARFDKQERVWRLWGEGDGFPVGQGPAQLVTDGAAAVVMTYGGGFFYLDAASDRWREGTDALSRAWAGQEGARVCQPDLLGVPPDVWVRGSAQWDDDHQGLPPIQSPLAVRWNVSEGFTRMEPPGWAPPTDANIRLLGSGLIADADAVWAMNLLGLWRWDRAARSWTAPALPPSFPDRFALTVGHMERSSDGAVWMIGRDTLLRWAGRDEAES